MSTVFHPVSLQSLPVYPSSTPKTQALPAAFFCVLAEDAAVFRALCIPQIPFYRPEAESGGQALHPSRETRTWARYRPYA